MTPFTRGFAEEIEKVAIKLSPEALRAILVGAGTGALTGTVGNVINPSADPEGKKKSLLGQIAKGGVIGGASGLGAHHIGRAVSRVL